MDAPSGDPPASSGRRIVERVSRLRRSFAAQPDPEPAAPVASLVRPEEEALGRRLQRVEAALEALQDQVYRESERHDRDLAEVHHQLRGEELAKVLSEDARRRGL